MKQLNTLSSAPASSSLTFFSVLFHSFVCCLVMTCCVQLVCISGGPDSGVSALMGLLSGEISEHSLWESLTHPGHKSSSTSIGPAASSKKTELERQLAVDRQMRAKQSQGHSKDTFVHGDILYDNIPRSQDFVQQVGFAPKNDNHLPYLTVRHTSDTRRTKASMNTGT
jgi:hypothetical protein